MPFFFFDLDDGTELHTDTIGSDLASLDEVRRDARSVLIDVARRRIGPGDGDRHCLAVSVRDEADRIVYSAKLDFTGVRSGP